MANVKYKNKKTGSVVTYPMAIPRLEKSDRWERVEDEPKPKGESKS